MNVLSKKAYLTLLIGDISALYASVWLTLAVRHFEVPALNTALVHLVSFSVLFLAWFVVYFLAGLYGRYTLLFRRNLPNVLFAAQAINIVIAVLFFFFIPFFQITPKVVLVIYLVVSTLLLYVWRVLIYPHILVRREIGAVLIGTSHELTELADEVNRDPLYPLEFRAIIHPELTSAAEAKHTLRTLIENGTIDAIVADMSNHALDDFLQYIYDLTFIERSAEFIDVRDVYQEVFQRLPLTLIDERWVLRYLSLNEHMLYSASKRLIDIIGALVLGILTLPLYPFIILAIKLESAGPIFYTTQRIGKGGIPFAFHKFRSMTGTDSGTAVLDSKLAVTRVGRILRRTRLDELPQLWSVVTGRLSFIGPRPELPALVQEYRAHIRHYNIRHVVKPGLSGWAQIHARHAHHGVDVDITKEKLAHDLYYIKERSLWLDVYIALLTIRTLVTSKGS